MDMIAITFDIALFLSRCFSVSPAPRRPSPSGDPLRAPSRASIFGLLRRQRLQEEREVEKGWKLHRCLQPKSDLRRLGLQRCDSGGMKRLRRQLLLARAHPVLPLGLGLIQ